VSIQLPTMRIARKYLSKSQFLMADFREIHYVVDKFAKSKFAQRLKQTPSYDVTKYDYNFYSADPDRMGVFKPTKEIFVGDKNLAHWQQWGNTDINVRNSFMRACVKITNKKE
jgi:hypothetical protein